MGRPDGLRVSVGLGGLLWGLKGRYGAGEGVMGCCGSVWVPMGLYGALWGGTVGLYESVWGTVGRRCGSLWGAVGRCGSLWVALGHCGAALWVSMGPYGSV